APDAGTPVLAGDKEAGELRSTANGHGLALLRLDDIAAAQAAGTPLTAGEAVLTPLPPPWTVA
ncbi:hypothetical protein, partial [Streptomyces galilaeus]|uniref:hypothetical protein n=1 Tax=Streptomyces galilaeus TaxID=33899 RepID=UPI0038F5D401